MSATKVSIDVQLRTLGIKEGTVEARAYRKELEGAQQAAASISTPKRSAAARNAPTTATRAEEVSREDYGRVRGSIGTGAAGRDFAKQSQGMGGVVALYATFAANIFAVGAAFEALNKAAAIERLSKATEMMSVSVGANLKGISKDSRTSRYTDSKLN